MRRFLEAMVRGAARCYPAAWRERYGDEFEALLEEAEPRWQDVWNVLRGALLMQLTTPAAYLKFGVVTAVIGAIAAAAASLAMPKRYVSTAVLQPPQRLDAQSARQLRRRQAELLSRGNLAAIMQQPSLDLYREDRMRYPMEDVIQTMRDRDLRIETVPGAAPGAPPAIRMTFSYEDPVKAQAVARELSARFSDGSLQIVSPANLPEKPVDRGRWSMIAMGLGTGLAAGLVIAFLRGLGVKWTLKLLGCGVAGALLATAVCLLVPETFSEVGRATEFVSLGAACGLTLGTYLLRRRDVRWGYAAQVAFCAAAFAIAAAVLSYVMPETYESVAELQVSAMGADGAAKLENEPAETVQLFSGDALSRGGIAELIQRPSLDLYRAERRRKPMENVVEHMREDLRIDAVPQDLAGPAVLSVQIAYRYPDRYKAQAVVRELVTKLVESSALRERRRDPKEGEAVLAEILKPPTLPESPVSPNRLTYVGAGAAAGALSGLLLGWRRRRQQRPQAPDVGPRPRYLRYALMAAGFGTLAAGLASLALPERYVSTAVIRVGVPGGQSASARAQEMIQRTATRDWLAEVLQQPGFDLYRKEHKQRPIDEVLQEMRARDLRITALPGSGPSARTAVLRVSFTSSSRERAQSCVQAVVNKLVENGTKAVEYPIGSKLFENDLLQSAAPQKLDATVAPSPATQMHPGSNPVELLGNGGPLIPPAHGNDLFADSSPTQAQEVRLEVLDAASAPGAPLSPNRATISAAGGIAGLMLGLALARLRISSPR